MTVKEAEKVECLLKCPHCGEEVPYEDVSFCPKCGKSLDLQQKRTDLVLAAAMLTIISAAFSAGLGYLAFDRYISFVFDYSFSVVLGFLIVAVISTVVSVFGIAGGIFMLKRKYVNFSMLTVILLLISAFGNYLTLQYYRLQYSLQYGFMEIALFSAILILIFSILSGIFITASKAEFA
ncbi:MAG: zinc-ribbon domain-containing protein [Candidatus Bathyarchaeota archaeon]